MMKRSLLAGLACVLTLLLAFFQLVLLRDNTAEQPRAVDVGGALDTASESLNIRGLRTKKKAPPARKASPPPLPPAGCDSWECAEDGSKFVADTSIQKDGSKRPPPADITEGWEQEEGAGGAAPPPVRAVQPGAPKGGGDKAGRRPPTAKKPRSKAGVAPPSVPPSSPRRVKAKGGGTYEKAPVEGKPSTKHVARDFFCENRAQGSDVASIDGSSMTSYISTGGRFPVVMVTKDRAEQLRGTLKSLLSVRCVTREDVYIVQDGDNAGVQQVITDAGVRRQVNPSNVGWGDGASKIAGHYGYALGQGFSAHPSAPAIIVAEDDFAFSPDFYEYFHAVAPVLEADPTLWLASAWHDNGFDYLVADPYGLRRTSYFPGLGWLLPRSTWEGELSAKWPGTHWDHWMRDPAQHKGREIVIPEIPRDYHMGIKGTFMDSGTHNRYFGSIAMQADEGFTWDTPTGAAAIEELTLTRYDARLRGLLSDPDTVHLSSVGDVAALREGNGVVWYAVPPGEQNHDHMRAVAGYFGVWHEGARGSRDGVHEVWWLGTSRLLLINAYEGHHPGGPHVTGSIAVSSLRSAMPRGQRVIDWSEFLNAERPQLPRHSNLFGAVTRSPLAHVDGGADANGAPDVGADSSTGEGAGSVVVYTRTAASGHEGEEEGGGHDHSRFMGDLRLSRGATPPAGGSGRGEGVGAASKIGVLPENVHVVASVRAGLSCDAVCGGYRVGGRAALAAAAAGSKAEQEEVEAEAGRWVCAGAYFPVLNDCSTLRDNFPCAKCIDSVGPDQPAMIDPAAPPDKAPGVCLVNTDASTFACAGRWTHAKRLCPCELGGV